MPEPLEAHSSDIQTAISRLHVKNTLIGYRNLLSYASALNVHIFKTEKINRHLWVSKASGTYSEVFETRLECEPPNEVVIKVPNASFTRDDEAVENLVQHQALSNIVREVRILTHQNLSNHDNLIRIFGIYLEEEDNPVGTRPCIVFEKAFETLSAYLKNSSVRVSEKSVVTFSADVAAGLSAIHAHGLVHGDLKPENVLMVLRHGRITCVLADFGTCGTSGQSEVEHGIIPGTPGFRAPEYYTSSCFHPWVNKPTRDVYGLGLIVFSIITNDSAPPFSSNSEKLQHDDVACLEYLRRCSFQNSATDLPWDIIQLCIRANPEERSSLALINSILRRAQGQHGEYDGSQELAQQLLSNPPDPRVRVLNNIKPSRHLHAKLLSEYELACDIEIDVRLATTMAALYAGVIGPPIEQPFDSVAKAQWLLKAIELGHLPAINAIYNDSNTFKIIEHSGQSLIFYRRPLFKSPRISMPLLLDRLKGAAAKADIVALNLLVFLGGDVLEHVQLERELSPSFTSLQRKLYEAFPALNEEPYFEDFLHQDLQLLDSDAIDMIVGRDDSEALRSAYNDDLEGFIQAAENLAEDALQRLLGYMILGSSVNVVRYIFAHFHINPNATIAKGSIDADASEEEDSEMSYDEIGSEPEGEQDNESGTDFVPNFDFFEPLVQDMTFLDTALSLSRPSLVQASIEYGAMIRAASGPRPSSLHFLARFDDEHFTAIVCESCANRTVLREIMESKPSAGPLENISALEINMHARKWRNILVMIQYAAGRFTRETESVLLLTAVSRMIPAPPFVLSAFLEHGFDADLAYQSEQPPLYWTIGTSNVLATAILLSYGASVSSSGDTNLISFAKECVDEIDCYGEVEVYNEREEVCKGGLERMKIAAQTVYELVLLAGKKDVGWKEGIETCIKKCPDDCKGKVWRADKTNPLEATILLEVSFEKA